MKLAEALILRADIQKRLEQLRQRLCDNALTQEGEAPAEDPKQLLKELSSCSEELEQLMTRINLTNAAARCKDKSLTEQLARRDVLTQKVSILRSTLEAASRKISRSTRSEVKILSTLDVPALRKELDSLSRDLRLLDTSIQEANGLTELQ